MFMDNLYLPGCDGIYQFGQTLPGLSHAWSRPIDYLNGSDRLFLYQTGQTIGFCYRNNQVNYYAKVRNERFTKHGYLVTDAIYRDKI